MNEHVTPEAQEETSNSSFRKIGEKALSIATHTTLVAGLAAGAIWAIREADVAPLGLFGDAIDFGPHINLDQGDTVMDVK